MHSKKARLSIKTRRLFCDGPHGSTHSGQGDVVGAFVRVLVEGEGGGSALGCVVLPRLAGSGTYSPSVEYGTSTGRDSPRGSSHSTDRRRVFMISIRYLIAGTHPHHLHLHGTSSERVYDVYGSGWIRSSRSVDQYGRGDGD